MSNLACRIFKEQLDLLLSLPNQEEAKTVLYQAVINSFNQFEYQNENQIENQNENAYVSVSASVSELSKSILNLLSKNIVWKEFSNNYGGKREKAGRPKKTKPIQKPKERKEKERVVSDDWTPKDSTIEKLEERNLDSEKVIQKFILSCQAKNRKYIDFDKAILSWNWENDKGVQKATKEWTI